MWIACDNMVGPAQMSGGFQMGNQEPSTKNALMKSHCLHGTRCPSTELNQSLCRHYCWSLLDNFIVHNINMSLQEV